jgi:AAA family ATP:ADP antiporter
MSEPAPPATEASLWSLVTGAKAHERPALALAFVYFFALLASYYMLRPLRDQFSAAVGSTNLWPFWTGTFIATLALAPVFGWLVARFPRERFMPVVYGFFILCLFAFVPAFRAQAQIGPRLLGIVFYIWVSVFNLFVVSVFWSYLADIFDSDQAKRLFPVVAFGGSAGAIVGPIIAKALPIESLLFGSAGMLALVVGCVFLLSKWARKHPNPDRQRELNQGAVIGGDVLAGIRQTLSSPFLRKMAALMLLGDVVGTVAYALVADYAGSHYATAEARKGFYAQIDLIINTLQILLQVSITRWLLARFGAGIGLVVPAAMNVLVLLAAALIGQPAVVATLVITRAGAYGMFKPAADSLYTRVDRENRYKSKNVIDTAVWRFGDVVSSGSMAILTPLGFGVASFALICAVAATLSGVFGWLAAHAPELAPERKD